ncbi:MAG: hypothetical protein R8K22_00110 [Mariprofundaceae bacterium]
MSIPTSAYFLSLMVVASLVVSSTAESGEWDTGGQASLDLRYFPHTAAHPGQKKMTLSPSVTLEPEVVYEFDNNNRVTLAPFVRLDADDEKRTHVDLREFYWLHLGSTWDLTLGVSKVFWGVTESVHLVDIINQTDAVEDISGEEKLGQPMINLNIEQSWGAINLFVLPGFRSTTFTADKTRLHGPLPVDTANPGYESGKGKRHIDSAVRWSRGFDDLDIAISHFQGTSREVRLLLQNRGSGPVLVPFYDQIGQTGLELQLTTNNTLWKSELMTRSGHGKRFYAAVAGFEHTLYGVAGSVADVGLLAEYLYDGRDPLLAPPSLADNDIFAGFRIAMNDTQDTTLLLGGLWDHQTDAGSINLEAERRLTDHIKVELTGRFFINIPNSDPIAAIRNDDFLELKLNYFF